ALEDILDAGRDRLGYALEVSDLYSARRQFTRRVLFDCDLERPPAGRQRDQDAAPRQEHDQPHYFQGHRSRKIQQHLSRPRYRASQGDQRPQLHQLRLAVDRPRLRRAHRAVYRGAEFLRDVRTRGYHLEDFRRHALLLPATRHVGGRGDRARRQRLRQGCTAAASHGIRGGSAKTDLDQSGRKRRLIEMTFLEVKNLHVEIEGKKILNGLNLSVEKGKVVAIMGPNGSGKSTLAYVLAGKDDYKVTEGDVLLNGESILAMAPDERAAKGVFLAFQYPVEVPGVATMTFLRTALNAQRKTRGEKDFSTPDFMKLVSDTASELGVSQEMLRRAVNVGFSGGEKKRNEILQMAVL